MTDTKLIDTRGGSDRSTIQEPTHLDLVNGLALPAASKQYTSEQISVVVEMTERDYGEEYGPISVVVTGKGADVKNVLRQLSNNNCTSFQFLDPETGKSVSLYHKPGSE